MIIEIMNGPTGCSMICPTCPKFVREMHGPHAELMPKAYKMLEEKLSPQVALKVSLESNINQSFESIEKFSINSAQQLGLILQFPIDVLEIKNTLQKLSTQFPSMDITLAALYKNPTVCNTVAEDLISLGRAFFTTSVPKLFVSLNNNSMATKLYREQLVNLMQADRDLFSKIAQQVGGKVTKDFNPHEAPDLESYESWLILRKDKREFVFGRRIVSFLPKENEVLEYYRERAENDLFQGIYSFTLTPMGVRINHRAVDIENPYLLITYEELFSALQNASIDIFLFRIQRIIKKTLSLHNEMGTFTTLTEKSLNELAQKRKSIF